MKIALSELKQQLEKSISQIYVVHGDEIFLSLRATDLIRRTLQKRDYEERVTFVAEAKFDWSALKAELNAISLFSEKKIIDLRIPTGKPGKIGSSILLEVVQDIPEHVTILITLPNLDRNARASKWFSSLEKSAICIEAKTIPREQLPNWIEQRLGKQNQNVSRDALELICDRVEGNLMAAHQEILKLGLLLPEGHLSTENVREAVVDVARYDVFDLGLTILKGEKALFIRTLKGLEAEASPMPLVLWVITEEAKNLLRLKKALHSGTDMRSALAEARIWGIKQKLVPNLAKKLSLETLNTAVIRASEIDQEIKGLKYGNPWDSLLRLGLSLIPATAS